MIIPQLKIFWYNLIIVNQLTLDSILIYLHKKCPKRKWIRHSIFNFKVYQMTNALPSRIVKWNVSSISPVLNWLIVSFRLFDSDLASSSKVIVLSWYVNDDIGYNSSCSGAKHLYQISFIVFCHFINWDQLFFNFNSSLTSKSE